MIFVYDQKLHDEKHLATRYLISIFESLFFELLFGLGIKWEPRFFLSVKNFHSLKHMVRPSIVPKQIFDLVTSWAEAK